MENGFYTRFQTAFGTTWDDLGFPKACNNIEDSVYMPVYYNIGTKFPSIPVKVPYGMCMPLACKDPDSETVKGVLRFVNYFMDFGVQYLQKRVDFNNLNKYLPAEDNS